MTIMSKTEYDTVRKYYEIIVNYSVIPKDPTATCDEVWKKNSY